MIIQTTKKINSVVYDYAYSDSGYMIERDGVRYSEAVDPIDSGRLFVTVKSLRMQGFNNKKRQTKWKIF